MSDVTPIVGPVYGWRTWNVHGQVSWAVDGDPPRLASRGGPWTSATQEAACKKNDLWSLSNFMLSPVEDKGPADHAPVTTPNCWCGLYAHATLANCLDKNAGFTGGDPGDYNYTMSRQVLGLVSASGRMIAAERGFRAQWMTVDTLVCIHHPEGGHQSAPVAVIAEGLGVEHVCVTVSAEDRPGTRESFNSLFAHRDGVYLWRKEAPWTSDVTNEAMRSSTQFHTGGTVPGMQGMSISFSLSDETWLRNMSAEKRSLPERLKDRWSIGRGGAA